MVAELLRERKRATHQAGDPLSQRTVEALHMIPLAGQLGDGPVLSGGNDPPVDCILIRVERRLLLIHDRNLLPQSVGALATARRQ